MDRTTLNWPRPDNGDLDNQVVKRSWLHARQHRHLGTRFNLENADCVRSGNHLVRFRVLGGDVLHFKAFAALFGNEVECAANS
ncbi:hypothetical protein HDG33_000174 [Paraburkholderia sp. Cpub6]|nr:hypothetical protein [Paraburkholderia sp. Cpub6]